MQDRTDRIETLESGMQQKDAEVQALQTLAQTNQSRIVTLETLAATDTQRINTIEQQQASIEQSVANNTTQIAEVQIGIQGLDASVQQLQTLIQSGTTDLSTLETEVNAAIADLETKLNYYLIDPLGERFPNGPPTVAPPISTFFATYDAFIYQYNQRQQDIDNQLTLERNTRTDEIANMSVYIENTKSDIQDQFTQLGVGMDDTSTRVIALETAQAAAATAEIIQSNEIQGHDARLQVLEGTAAFDPILLEMAVQALQTDLAAETAARQQGDSDIGDALQASSDAYDALSGTVSGLNGSITANAMNISLLGARVSGAEAAISTLQTASTANSSTIDQHTTSIGALNTTTGSHTTSIASLTSSVSTLTTDVAALQAAQGSVVTQQDITDLNLYIQNVEATVPQFRTQTESNWAFTGPFNAGTQLITEYFPTSFLDSFSDILLENIEITAVLHLKNSGLSGTNLVAGTKINYSCMGWTRSTSSAFHRGMIFCQTPSSPARSFYIHVMGGQILSTFQAGTDDAQGTINFTDLQAIYFSAKVRNTKDQFYQITEI